MTNYGKLTLLELLYIFQQLTKAPLKEHFQKDGILQSFYPHVESTLTLLHKAGELEKSKLEQSLEGITQALLDANTLHDTHVTACYDLLKTLEYRAGKLKKTDEERQYRQIRKDLFPYDKFVNSKTYGEQSAAAGRLESHLLNNKETRTLLESCKMPHGESVLSWMQEIVDAGKVMAKKLAERDELEKTIKGKEESHREGQLSPYHAALKGRKVLRLLENNLELVVDEDGTKAYLHRELLAPIREQLSRHRSTPSKESPNEAA